MDIILFKPGESAIKGESQINGHKDEIELLAYNHGISMQMTGDPSNTARTSGKPQHQEFSMTKYLDLATPKLIEFCNKGDSIGKCEILLARNDDGKVEQLVKYILENCIISSHSVGAGSGNKPVEKLTLNYTKVTWEYKAQKSAGQMGGTSSTTWDLATNQAK